jgi:ADP-heptose:LPS heptosyltransferase
MTKKILVAPYAKKLEGKDNPKNYPYWEETIYLIKKKLNEENVDVNFCQLGISGEVKLKNCDGYAYDEPIDVIKKFVFECDTFICVDTWLQHMAHYYGKKGFVIWSASDPNIFGYPENENILKDRKYLRPKQFDSWINPDVSYNQDSFFPPIVVAEMITTKLLTIKL